jgi:hypothetical protein
MMPKNLKNKIEMPSNVEVNTKKEAAVGYGRKRFIFLHRQFGNIEVRSQWKSINSK